MEINGKVHEIGAVQQVSGTFKKRDLIVVRAENPQYPEYLRFEAVRDKVALLDGLAAGDAVTVHFDLRGRPWTDRNGRTQYFNTLVARKVEKQGAAEGGPGDGLPF